jgi:hypothetical protein
VTKPRFSRDKDRDAWIRARVMTVVVLTKRGTVTAKSQRAMRREYDKLADQYRALTDHVPPRAKRYGERMSEFAFELMGGKNRTKGGKI